MKTIQIPAPNKRQSLFLADTHRYVAFGGARGGGKSWAVRVKAILLACRWPGIKILIMRRTYDELLANHIEPLQAMLGGAVRYHKTNKEFLFPNGSRIKLRAAATVQDTGKYQGTEYDVLFIDEATQIEEEYFKRLLASARGVNDYPHRVYLTCNPGGVGHSWVKRLFVDRAFNANERPEEYAFIKSLVTDNTALMEKDPEYIRYLESLPPKLRKAWLEGDWDIFEGQFFEEFAAAPVEYECREHHITAEEALKQRRWTHVIEPFRIPPDWAVYRSFDWGFAKPFSCDYWAVDYDGRAYLFYQYYGCSGIANEGIKKDPHWVFAKIHELETGVPELRGREFIGVADPSIWDRSRGESIAEAAAKHYVYFSPGDNTRIPGWMQCHYRLAFDADGYPMVYFFNTCAHAVRTLPLLQYDEHKPEDLDTTQEDHFADSFRYFCMARPIAPRAAETRRPRGDDPLNLYSAH